MTVMKMKMKVNGATNMTQLTDYKALTFDCYGTLIDWESGILQALQPWLNFALACDQPAVRVGTHP